MKNPYKKPTDQPDLNYTDARAFNEGREAFKTQARNPYFSWQQDKRHDWTVGYLYAQRLHNLEQAGKLPKS